MHSEQTDSDRLCIVVTVWEVPVREFRLVDSVLELARTVHCSSRNSVANDQMFHQSSKQILLLEAELEVESTG